MPSKPYIELHYTGANKVLTGAEVVYGDLKVPLPNLADVRVEAGATGPQKVELMFYGLHTVEVWSEDE